MDTILEGTSKAYRRGKLVQGFHRAELKWRGMESIGKNESDGIAKSVMVVA
jgi:hypothetical protein